MPAPDGPTRAVRLPRAAENDTPWSTARGSVASTPGDEPLSDGAAGATGGTVYSKSTSWNEIASADAIGGAALSAIRESSWVSVGRPMISWMRPRAPSAWLTELMAPNAVVSGMIIMKRNRMNDTRFAMVMAPLATLNPPTPSTMSSDTCSAIPATGTTSAEILATAIPMSQAPFASFSMVAISRSVALDARTVRIAPSARSTAADRSPTFSCCLRLAILMRPESSTTVTTEMAMTSTVRPSSSGSMMSMAMSAPTNTSEPPTASTSPWVMTAYNSVVSEPTRETRSPVRRESYSRIGSRSIRLINWRRAESTTEVPVRCRR